MGKSNIEDAGPLESKNSAGYGRGAATLPISAPRVALLIALAALAAVAAATWSEPALAHNINSPPSLNEKGDVVYRCDSRYYCNSYAWSRGQWNARPGEPSVFPKGGDRGSTSLIILDTYDSTTTVAAYWTGYYDPDRIYNNNYHMLNYGTAKRRIASTHELGHAFTMWHTQETSTYCRNSVMYPYVPTAFNCGQRGYLGSHDKSDWIAIWGRR